MIKVLLADDQALVRAGFRALLDAQDDVEVVDDGHGSGNGSGGGGRGISGMRERARALGGSLEAGPRPGGGFRVQASLPVGGR